jgi:hypothetical protein
MKFPIHAWRRRSVVPEMATVHPDPLASPPTSAVRDPDVHPHVHDAGLPISTARRTQSTRLEMKQMIIEDWATTKVFLKHMVWQDVLRACVRRWLWSEFCHVHHTRIGLTHD